jgi:MtN3 and saliva related transmembrane protein
MNRIFIDKAAFKILRRERTNIDRLTLALGIIGPMATIPQIIEVYASRDASGISLLSWIFYLITALLGLAYSLVHRLRPLTVGNILWIIADIILIQGIIAYS